MNDLVRITQAISDPENLRSDIAEAAALVSQHFKEKYIAPVNSIYTEKRARCMEKPSPQVALLQACRPFLQNTDMLDRMIDGLTGFDAAALMMQEYRGRVSVRSRDECVHPDGVYEVDDRCLAVSTNDNAAVGTDILPVLLLLLLTAKFNR